MIAFGCRAFCLVVALAGIGGMVGTAVADEADTKLPNGEPILRMPFPAGNAVLCLQGNDSPRGYSHSVPHCRHALDFSDPSEQAIDIVAAASGVVAYAFSGSTLGDHTAGYGFGNHVKLDHGDGYFTLYAHLDAVSVKVGDQVPAGVKLGTLGNTGASGLPHLHFSLHRGDPKQPAVPHTVPIHALIAADLTTGSEFNLFTSLELVAEAGQGAPEGHLYGSENAPGRALLLGVAPADLGTRLAAAAKRLRAAKDTAEMPISRVNDIVKQWDRNGAEWVRDRLERIVAEQPGDMEAWYWIGVIR